MVLEKISLNEKDLKYDFELQKNFLFYAEIHNKFTDKVDMSVALFKTISNTILNTNIQVDTFIQSKIISPALTFVREKFELQNQNFKENFKENLAQQREKRQNIHVSRVKIEPKMSI